MYYNNNYKAKVKQLNFIEKNLTCFFDLNLFGRNGTHLVKKRVDSLKL
jgi:hypothetical protein